MQAIIFRTNVCLDSRLPCVHHRIALGFFVPILLAAADPTSQPENVERVGLNEALEAATAAHPDLEEPRAAIQEAKASADRARAGWLPRGELRAIFGIVNGARVGEVPEGLPEELAPLFSDDGAGDPLNELGPFLRANLRVTQPLFTFGKISHGIAAAEAGVEARKAELNRQASDIRLEVRKIYYGYQLASELVRALDSLASNFSDALEKAEGRLGSAEAPVTQADILKLRIAANSIKKRVLELRRQRDVSILAFRRAIGRKLDEPVFPSSERLKPAKIGTSLLEQLEVKAFASPAWRAAQAGLQAREEAAASAQSQLYPDVFIGVQVEANWAPTRDDIRNPFLRDEFNRIRGGPFFGVRWPIDLAVKLARRDKARAEVSIQRARVERARVGLPLKIRRAYLKYNEKRQAMALSRQNRKASRGLSFLTAANFRIGVGEAKDILESLGLYGRSLAEYYRSVFEHNLAVGELLEVVSSADE